MVSLDEIAVRETLLRGSRRSSDQLRDEGKSILGAHQRPVATCSAWSCHSRRAQPFRGCSRLVSTGISVRGADGPLAYRVLCTIRRRI